jgi:cell division protein FtsX
MNKQKKGQQEMVGFVLIVVIVVIAMMVFLTINITKEKNTTQDSTKTRATLDSILGITSNCAINFEPQYDTIEELFKSSHKNKNCKNLGISATEALTKELENTMKAMIALDEATTPAITITLQKEENNNKITLLEKKEGTCPQGARITGARRHIISSGENLIITLNLCEVN